MLDWFYGGGGLKPSFPVCVGHRLCGLFEGWWVCGVGVGVNEMAMIATWLKESKKTCGKTKTAAGAWSSRAQNLEPAPKFL
jgi:hypothetical protein